MLDQMKPQREGSVTAVIPTRNRPEEVCAAVRSALAQTNGLVEVIVVIDGPDAATVQALIALQTAERDGRLRVLPLASPVGGAEARNIGVRHARAHWIAFLDDDDLWLPHKLAAQLREAEASEAKYPVISSAVIARGPKLEAVWPRRLYQPGESMAEYLFCRQGWTYGEALLQTSTLLAPRELLLRLPFALGLKKHQDWDWLLRANIEPGVSLLQIAEPLAVFSVEGNRASVGRTPDWRFSRDWAYQRRDSFTPRALSAFLATECAPQAARAGASIKERCALLLAMLRLGSPSVRLCVICLGFLVVPQGGRRWLRALLKPAARYVPPQATLPGNEGYAEPSTVTRQAHFAR